MTKWIGTGVLAVIAVGAAAAPSAQAASRDAAAQRPHVTATDLSVRHPPHRYRHAYPAYSPAYYGRPTYYSPVPVFVPLPPLWGYGWEWW